MEANMLEAKTRLSQLVEAAEKGEQVFIKRNGLRVAQLIPIAKTKFPFGFLRDKVGPIDDSLLFAMTDEEAEQLLKKPY
jgi:prevent-host-death family protein